MKNTRGFIQLLIIILLLAIGSSFAYFTAVITGSETNTTISLSGGVMNIAYSSGPNINISDIFPREEAWATKTFTLTGNNTTTNIMNYDLYIVVVQSNFTAGALKFTLTNVSQNGDAVSQISQKSIRNTAGDQKIGSGHFTGPTGGNKTHVYTFKLFFPDNGTDQSKDQNKTFGAYIDVREKEAIPSYYVMGEDTDFTLVEGVIVDSVYNPITDSWDEIYDDIYIYSGTKDYIIIPEKINGKIITTARSMFGFTFDNNWQPVNGNPIKGVATLNNNIINMSQMFTGNQSTEIELKYLDTSNVTKMSSMFSDSSFEEIDLDGLDTSSVTDMSGMFHQVYATSINLSGIDTSNVTTFQNMFSYANINSLDVSSLDGTNVLTTENMFSGLEFSHLDLSMLNTQNVINMEYMFSNSDIDTVNLTNFSTKSVTNMRNMFSGSNFTSLNLNSFDTKNVTNMEHMFAYSLVVSLDLTSFNTSNVTNMSYMFSGSLVVSLDLTSFNTTKVTKMSGMFSDSNATSINLSSFKTPNLEQTAVMFRNTKVSIIDLSTFDTSNVTYSHWMFNGSLATTGYAKTQADADLYNSTTNKPAGLTFVVK